MSRKFKKLRVQNDSPNASHIPVSVYPNQSRAKAISNWILFGDEAGKEAVKELFHVKDCKCALCAF